MGAYHAACAEESRRASTRRSDQARWARLDAEQRAKRLAAQRTHYARAAATTRPHAHRRYALWTAAEDAALLERWREPGSVVAIALGRTAPAVANRKARLRRRGTAPDRT